MECGALAPLSARDFSPRKKAMDDQTLNDGPDEQVPPERRTRQAGPTKKSFANARLSCPVKQARNIP